jgi:ASCH domain-containing protein
MTMSSGGGRCPALSVRQPWAELIVTGRKRLEIRTWETPYRGRIWIHAPRHVNPDLEREFGLLDVYRGGFVGAVALASIEPIDAGSWEAWRTYHLDSGSFQPGLFGWVLSDPHKFAVPVAAPGNRGLYDVGADVHQRLLEAAAAGSSAQ